MSSASGSHLPQSVVVAISPFTAWEELGGEVVAWQEQHESMHRLTGAAAAVLRTLDGVRDLEQVVARLSDQFDVAPGVLREDVLGFVGQLLERGLVRRVP